MIQFRRTNPRRFSTAPAAAFRMAGAVFCLGWCILHCGILSRSGSWARQDLRLNAFRIRCCCALPGYVPPVSCELRARLRDSLPALRAWYLCGCSGSRTYRDPRVLSGSCRVIAAPILRAGERIDLQDPVVLRS